MTDCERSPENGARDTCGAGVPGEDEGADGEDDALGSDEAERRQGQCNPQWGQHEDADEESGESGSGCGRGRRLLGREEVGKGDHRVEEDVTPGREGVESLHYLIKALLMAGDALFGYLRLALLVGRLYIRPSAGGEWRISPGVHC